MAKKYLVPIDMSGLEIQNFLAHNLATAPTGVGGKVYFNTTDHKLYYHNGTSWVDLSASGEMNVQSDWSQTDNTADDYIKNKPTLGTAAAKDSTTSIASGGTDLPTAGTVYDYVSTAIGAVDAMRFKGTVNSNSDLPTTGVKVGDTYMVNTAGTYAGQTCEVGDLIIATATTPTWTVAQTNIDGAITSLTGQNGVSVTGSGASRTIEFDASTAPVASTSAFGIMKIGNGLSASSGVVSTSIKQAVETISAGNTSSGATMPLGAVLYGYCATDETTEEEVIVDYSRAYRRFSIASAHTNNIKIRYLYFLL